MDAAGGLEFRAAHADPRFASSGSREALSMSDGSTECAYDVFGGVVNGIVVFGTGYAALTRHLVSRLVKRDLIAKTRFMVPKLHDIVEFCRASHPGKLPMKFTATGFSAFVPGVKNLRQIKLGGSDVFNSGLVEQIERWLKNRGSSEGSGDAINVLQYQALRLKAVGTLSGSAASLSLARDGACKIWVRKSASNLPEFMDAVLTLKSLDKFETTTKTPSWSEEAEV
jgi:hypothetical protein